MRFVFSVNVLKSLERTHPPTLSPPEEEKGSQNNKKNYTLSPLEVETGRIQPHSILISPSPRYSEEKGSGDEELGWERARG